MLELSRKTKVKLPNSFYPRKIESGSSLYEFTNDIILLSYVPKKNKAVLLVSSMQHTKSMATEMNKPKIVALYNTTKGGVDSIDHKCTNYSTNRRSR